jgi:hypothetical protein
MKIAMVLLTLFFAYGCMSPPDRAGRNALSGEMGVFTLDGHEYVVWDGYHAGGIVHHAGCPCIGRP